MEYNYCRRCGSALEITGADAYICAQGHRIYANPGPGSHVWLVDRQRNIYVGRRSVEPGMNMLGALGGFLNTSETAEHAAKRELLEETGLTEDDYGPLNFLTTATNRYEYQGEQRAVLAVAFWAELHDADVKMTASDDVAEIVKLPLDEAIVDDFYGEDSKVELAALRKLFRNS